MSSSSSSSNLEGAQKLPEVVAPVPAEERKCVQRLAEVAAGGLFDTANAQNGQSELGTFDHWRSEYARDLERFCGAGSRGGPQGGTDSEQEEEGTDEEDDDDVEGSEDSDGGAGDSGKRKMGQIWYGRQVAARQAELVAPFCTPGSTVVDVGAGNGELLCRLAMMKPKPSTAATGAVAAAAAESLPSDEETQKTPGRIGGEEALEVASSTGWAHFIGTDYCAEAVLLARAVAQAQSEQHPECARLEFLADDIFHSSLPPHCADVLLDKGTLDALSCLFDDKRGTERVLAYGRALARLGKVGSTVLCVTSGNFSLEELHDVLGYAGWQYLDHVRDYPTFQFMGVTGTHVRTVLYRLGEDPETVAAKAAAKLSGAAAGGTTGE